MHQQAWRNHTGFARSRIDASSIRRGKGKNTRCQRRASATQFLLPQAPETGRHHIAWRRKPQVNDDRVLQNFFIPQAPERGRHHIAWRRKPQVNDERVPQNFFLPQARDRGDIL
jgi:hypothetical protein